MEHRMKPAEVIARLEAHSGRLHKERILRDAWDQGCVEFFQGAQLAYDALVTFNVNKAPLFDNTTDPLDFVPSLDWAAFVQLLDQLRTRQVTGNAARDLIRAASDGAAAADWNGWYRRVLLKDLKCGITDSTINKILEKAGPAAEPYIIPVFSCQLAKNGDDHPKKISGIKLLDPKLDGCLSASWTIEFEDGRRVTIAEVVENRIEGRIKSFNPSTGKIEYNKILNWAKNGSDINDTSVKWYRITLENGNMLPPLTGNHLVWLPLLKCWRRVDLLMIGDKLLQDT